MNNWENEWLETNRASWDERVPIHATSAFYDVASFKAGAEHLRPFELVEVGDVSGKSLAHLQCHFGIDSLCWARRGATVSGLDFSAPAIETARSLASQTGIDAEFVQVNVYDAPRALGNRTFDVVYTGLGALNWLPDIRRWAGVVSSLVKPGGFLYLVEFHPFTNVFGDEDLSLEHDYFHEGMRAWEDPGTYADLGADTVHNRTYERDHTLGEIVSAIAGSGLVIEFLHEHDYTLFPRWPGLEKTGSGTYHLPETTPSLPLMFSLRAEKPAN
ncbi:MAG: class I SAM-dependent methyltransferase [Rubrobacteraceae bacterium]